MPCVIIICQSALQLSSSIHLRVPSCSDGGNAPTYLTSTSICLHRLVSTSHPHQAEQPPLSCIRCRLFRPPWLAWTDRRHLHLQHNKPCHLVSTGRRPVPSPRRVACLLVIPDSVHTTNTCSSPPCAYRHSPCP
ncbi:hypothetical protein CGRA01v4_08883 [Colletotrichum graminicola]|nr:hypothetical protein CGRA01v4_08883 [Colletotrichum graminicola]